MKKFLITLFVMVLIAVAGVFGYGWWVSQHEELKISDDGQGALSNIVDKVQDTQLKSKDGTDVQIDELITTNDDGSITPNVEAIKNLDEQSLQDIANTMSEDDINALKNEVLSNPALMQEALQFLGQ